MERQARAVVVLSGGLDSATCLAIAVQRGFLVHALTFDYGQRHRREVDSARKLAQHYQVEEHRVAPLDFLREIGGSALTDAGLDVPTAGVAADTIPVTYVPGRNLIFLSIAAAYAEVVDAGAVYIGVNALDYSGYPDCRPEFIASFTRTALLATKRGVEGAPFAVLAPLQHMGKREIIQLGSELGVPYELTTSCYQGDELACGVCDSCRLRLAGFAAAGLADPLPYARTPSTDC